MESGCEMTNAQTFETNKAYAKSKPKSNPNIELIHHHFCNNFHSIPISHANYFLLMQINGTVGYNMLKSMLEYTEVETPKKKFRQECQPILSPHFTHASLLTHF
jgi:hypothetical protein